MFWRGSIVWKEGLYFGEKWWCFEEDQLFGKRVFILKWTQLRACLPPHGLACPVPAVYHAWRMGWRAHWELNRSVTGARQACWKPLWRCHGTADAPMAWPRPAGPALPQPHTPNVSISQAARLPWRQRWQRQASTGHCLVEDWIAQSGTGGHWEWMSTLLCRVRSTPMLLMDLGISSISEQLPNAGHVRRCLGGQITKHQSADKRMLQDKWINVIWCWTGWSCSGLIRYHYWSIAAEIYGSLMLIFFYYYFLCLWKTHEPCKQFAIISRCLRYGMNGT